MKILFMGTPTAAAVSLQRLIDDGHEIVAVYTQPDRPSGRGNRVQMSAVKELAIERGLTVVQPAKLKPEESKAEFRSVGADVAVVVAYGRILPAAYLDAFKYGAINVHFSLLPKYRGAAPVNWAIVNGEATTGVTTINMDVGLDTGDILIQSEAAIGAAESSVQLMDQLAVLGAETLANTLTQLDSLVPEPQDHKSATFAPIMKKADGQIDWSMSAIEVERRIRGFQPFPSSFSYIDCSRVTFFAGKAMDLDSDEKVGAILSSSNGELVVKCGSHTAISILELQLEGKRRVGCQDAINSGKFAVGKVFGGIELRCQTKFR